MKLRKWQSECISAAMKKYQSSKHFLALATPGAGKTLMASVLAKKLFDQNKIDLVLCFSPSSIVSQDFSDALSKQFNALFNGTMGAKGNSYTYQALNSLPESIWLLFKHYRIFVIFDEIHHCAGASLLDSNTWGASIISKIKDSAFYSIALTGTPWRSDASPIALAEYCNESGEIQCNYSYGLKESIRDKVCRVPQIIALDNDYISLVTGNDSSLFSSFTDLLSSTSVSYSEIVTNDDVIIELLILANTKLDELREENISAGGLIVASSISHAYKIQLILDNTFGETAQVVTSDDDNPSSIIKIFRSSSEKWIISVGMISEGTNIPRLQVCCYLSNVKTEMYFRQVLGRILRLTNANNQEAAFFMLAEVTLLKYAHRIVDDIPDELACVSILSMDQKLATEHKGLVSEDTSTDEANALLIPNTLITLEGLSSIGDLGFEDGIANCNDIIELYDTVMDISGQFFHTELQIEGLDYLSISTQSRELLSKYSNRVF